MVQRVKCVCLFLCWIFIGIVAFAEDEAASSTVGIFAVGRQAYVRAEKNATYAVAISNLTDALLSDVHIKAYQIARTGQRLASFEKSIGGVREKSLIVGAIPVDPRLRPGAFSFLITVSGMGRSGGFSQTKTLEATVGSTFSERMPVVMWGGRLKGLSDVGFTHLTETEVGYSWRKASGVELNAVAFLDDCVKSGVKLIKYEVVTYPDGEKREKFYRRTRDGKNSLYNPKRPAEEVSNPRMLEQARWQATRNARLLGQHPGLGGLLAVSEARDHSFPSFNTEHKRYEEATGCAVPEGIRGRALDLKVSESRFPDGLVPDDDPFYCYYDWFWRGGDGWPAYCSAIADVYRKEVNVPFFSFWDPAVRCPPMWCAVKGVDYLNQWCYAVPDPMNVAGPLEEMFAMAEGTPGQQVMMMTQLICYRRSVAPTNTVVDAVPRWYAKRPRAAFPTIPPDTLTESLWSMIAKPVKGIMFHGYGTIFETGSETGYCYTNPETTKRLRNLLKGVVEPLGPVLLRLGRDASPVAVLESSTTALMGGPATYGWSAPAITFLQRARLDPRVIYEDTIRRDGLKGIRVLYAPQLRFTTSAIIKAISDFQRSGGILIGDSEIVKALKPDILVPIASFNPPILDNTESFGASELARTGDVNRRQSTWNAKAKMQQDAETLLKQLISRGFLPTAVSTSPEIVVYNRKWRDVPYLFALNDKRTFGDYVGAWGCTMEKGLPFEGKVSLTVESDGGAVYELSRGGEVAFNRKEGRIVVPLSFETNDGRMLAFLPQKIESVSLEVPDSIARGENLSVRFRIYDKAGDPVAALLPTEIRVYDARGNEIDGAGWTCSENGVAALEVPLNMDDPDGAYTVWCRDRASGLTAMKKVYIGSIDEKEATR